MEIVFYLGCAVAAYLLGLARGIGICKVGSGNIVATNP